MNKQLMNREEWCTAFWKHVRSGNMSAPIESINEHGPQNKCSENERKERL